MRPLRVASAGEKAQQVELRGDPRNPEPDHFRVVFPGGDVDLARCDDGSYWIHVRVDRPGAGDDAGDGPYGAVLGARVDVHGRHTAELDPGLLADPGLYHLAVRVGRTERPVEAAMPPVHARPGQQIGLGLTDGDG